MLHYNMKDFDEMASLANEIRKYFPKEADLAVIHFESSYSRLVSLLIVSMLWNYLEAEKIVADGLNSKADPLSNTRKWTPQDFLRYQHIMRN